MTGRAPPPLCWLLAICGLLCATPLAAQTTEWRDDPKPPAGQHEARLLEAESLKSSEPARALELARAERERMGDATPAEVRAWQRNLEAWALWKLGELDEALALAAEAETLARAVDHRGTLAEALQLRGLVQLDNSDFEEALKNFELGLVLAQEMGEHWAIGQAYNNQGIVLRRLGRMEEAVQAYTQALEHRRLTEDPGQVAQTLNNLGVTLNYLGDYTRSLAAHAESLEIKRRIGEDEELSDSLYNIAAVYEQLGDFEAALQYYQESYEFDERAGQKRNMALGQNKISLQALKLGRLDEARVHANHALALFEELGRGQGAANALVTLARVSLAEDKPAEAEAPLQRALAIGEESGERGVAANARLYLAEASLAQGKAAAALPLVVEAVAIFRDVGLKAELRDSLALASRVQQANGDLAAALDSQREYDLVGRELLDEQRLRQLGSLRRTVELQQREHEITQLQERSEAQAREVERATWARNFWLAIAAGVFLLLFALASRYWHRRELQAQRKVNESLQRLDALKDEFLANTSHELRTPLVGIQGLAESLQQGEAGRLSDKGRRELGLILASGARLGTLIDDILDFSAMRRDQLSLHPTQVDLHVAADLVVALSRPLLEGKPVELVNDVPPGVMVLADEDRLQQILHNLVGNACKFTAQGSIRVRLDGEREDGRITIVVEDTGIGIPADRLEAIFQPFEQADGGITRQYGGTGLGLAVARQLVELHGGHLHAQPRHPKGSRFTFDLEGCRSPPCGRPTPHQTESSETTAPPVARKAGSYKTPNPARHPPQHPDPTPATTATQPTQPTPTTTFRILVIDDEPLNRQVLATQLGDEFLVEEAATGTEALHRLEHDHFDLVLLDLMMPGMSGLEVCTRLRERRPAGELPVILLTASNRLDDLLHGFAAGANDFLSKPVARAELQARVRTHLRLLDMNRHLEKRVDERTAELRQASEQLRRASETDFLTGLPNRRGLLARLDAGHVPEGAALLLLDIDNFKQVNDEHGHELGDAVLQGVAEELRATQREGDLVSRWGGEEFVVLLQGADDARALAIAERIRQRIATRDYQRDGRHVRATATLGIALATGTHAFDILIRTADEALYRGKAAGKDRVQLAGEGAATTG